MTNALAARILLIEAVVGDADLLGRDDELAAIDEFVRAHGLLPGALVLVGQAGIGKTTLWRHALASAEQSSFRALSCSPAESETGLSFGGMAELLDEVFEDAVRALPAPQARALAVVLRRADPGANPLDQFAVRVGFLNALRALSSETPIAVAVDDVQWLDRPSSLALGFVLRRMRRERVVFLLARRLGAGDGLPFEVDPRRPELRILRLEVGPLSIGAIHAMLRSRLGFPLPRPVLRDIHETSGGNPFYALELGNAFARSAQGRGAEDPIPLSETLQALVAGRLARLSARAVDVLLAASALARPSLEVLEAVYGRARVQSALHEAERIGVAAAVRRRVRFAHPLFAAGCYASANVEHRRRTHRRLARAVHDPEEQARHLALSVAGPIEEVAAELDQAAEHAARRGAPQAATELAELALVHTPREDDPSAVRRRLVAGDYHLTSGDAPRARTLYREGLRHSRAGGERADVLIRLAEIDEDADACVELCERALDDAGEDNSRACRIHTQLSVGQAFRGRGTQALSHARAAVVCAEQAGEGTLLASALTNAAEREYVLGSKERAFECLARALELEPEIQVPLFRSPRLTLARGLTYQGRHEEARDILVGLLQEAEDRGDERARLRIIWNLAELEIDAGNFAQGLHYATDGLDLAEAAGIHAQRFLFSQANAAAYLGRVQQARETVAACLAVGELTKTEDLAMATKAVLGFLELSLGDAVTADLHLRPLPALQIDQGVHAPGFYVWGNAIDALVAVGELEQARALTDKYECLARRMDDAPRELAEAARCRGLVRGAEGDIEAALRAFEASLEIHRRTETPFERARTLLCYGTALRRGKRRGEARRALEEALAEFARLSTPLWAEKARSELARIGGRTRVGALTETERRIAELVAEGRSNKEVASALFVTPKTVETRLSRMYAKLGIHSRGELTRRVLEEQRVGIS